MNSMMLAAALMLPGAPIPRETPPTGPAPYILQLRAANDGKTRITVMRTETQKVMTATVTAGPNGQQVVEQVEKEVPISKYVSVEVDELKDLKAYTADGKDLKPKEAAEKIGKGATVVASANGQKPDAGFLKMFKDDVIVLCSPDLVPQQGGRMGRPGFGGGGFEVMPLPAPVPGIAQPVPGGIQIQIGGAGVIGGPLIPAPVELPVEAPVVKPVEKK